MKASVKWIFPFLLVIALISTVPAGYAGDIPQQSPLLAFADHETSPASLQTAAMGPGPQTIVLAAARHIPDGKVKPKKSRKVKEPDAGDGCGDNGYLRLGTGADVEITTPCTVAAATYHYGYVNIHSGGKLTFEDATIDFWAKSILVENEGSLIVGSFDAPIGKKNLDNVVTFHLYGGKEQTVGITCKTTDSSKNLICGVPKQTWDLTPSKESDKVTLPSGVKDFFYKYQLLPADDYDCSDGKKLTDESYFGLKTLAVSYGGTLQMYGRKGADYQDPNPYDDPQASSSGMSWARLNQNVCPPNSGSSDCNSDDSSGKQLVLDRPVNWQKNDWIVVTATDYVPNHSEMRQIASITTDAQKSVITVTAALSYPHNGQKYDLASHDLPTRLDNYGEDFMKSVDTRAAVALLTRSIRIVSEACSEYGAQCNGLPEAEGSYFGGHVIARQGFKQFQMQGVELKQLGQGGRMAHSPVNFHMTRKLPSDGQANPAFVVDCSVNESMTRMYEIRGTQGVILKRNVGYKSIGHGYYLAEGTETGNTLKANIGIYARPAVDYRDNPRKVPGCLSSYNWMSNFAKYATDVVHPSVFYIANGYNTFEDNMAVGAGTCGACYWFAPVQVSGLSMGQSWESYAKIQLTTPGNAPLYRFHGNFCSTAMYSLMTIATPAVCDGVANPLPPPFKPTDQYKLHPLPTLFHDAYFRWPSDPRGGRDYYPNLGTGAVLASSICGKAADCSTVKCTKGETANCAVNVIDSYTSSFHWAPQNYSAVWLRTNWFLFTNSALTDVLNGGLTMVSGGSWDQVVNRYWALTRKSVFIGQTQKDEENIFAQNQGPVNPDTKGKAVCQEGSRWSYCRVWDGQGKDEGILIPRENFAVYQRLYNIYDGPVYQETNAFLHIKQRPVDGFLQDAASNFLYRSSPGIVKATEGTHVGSCIMPNAAIGWKQPNGFYYPPAFHSKNLFFDDVDIRHYVIVPLFKPGTLDVNENAVRASYCTFPTDVKSLFASTWTDIDRQTELNDDDGSLSGLSGTISVNKDQFYYAPKSPFECLSEQTCYQSPYDYVSAVVFPNFTLPTDSWSLECENTSCYGVPIYRQYLNTSKGENTKGPAQGIRMMGAATGQRSTMVANNGVYFIDTAKKQESSSSKSVFEANKAYNFFLLYAKSTTKVTFELYVGKNADFHKEASVKMVRVGTHKTDGTVLVLPVHFNSDQSWPATWSREYVKETGILTVKIDLETFADDFDNAKEESCGPPSFCQWNNTVKECRCAAHDDKNNPNPIGFSCDNSSSICGWSSLRSECPSGGCFGFQVTFPAAFGADDLDYRPDAGSFPDAWTNVEWEKASEDLCLDPKLGKESPIGYDPTIYPVGPCFYSADHEIPKNADLPSSVSAESADN